MWAIYGLRCCAGIIIDSLSKTYMYVCEKNVNPFLYHLHSLQKNLLGLGVLFSGYGAANTGIQMVMVKWSGIHAQQSFLYSDIHCCVRHCQFRISLLEGPSQCTHSLSVTMGTSVDWSTIGMVVLVSLTRQTNCVMYTVGPSSS